MEKPRRPMEYISDSAHVRARPVWKFVWKRYPIALSVCVRVIHAAEQGSGVNETGHGRSNREQSFASFCLSFREL